MSLWGHAHTYLHALLHMPTLLSILPPSSTQLFQWKVLGAEMESFFHMAAKNSCLLEAGDYNQIW